MLTMNHCLYKKEIKEKINRAANALKEKFTEQRMPIIIPREFVDIANGELGRIHDDIDNIHVMVPDHILQQVCDFAGAYTEMDIKVYPLSEYEKDRASYENGAVLYQKETGNAVMKYPVWFDEEQKEVFNQIRAVAKKLQADALLVDKRNNGITVMIELSKESVSPSDWEAVAGVGENSAHMFIEFALTHENREGERYAVG